MDNHKPLVRPIAVVLASVVLLVLPLMWHILCLDKDGSTDYLAYIGALLGAVATIVAVVWEIRSDATVRKEEYELATQPIIWCGIDEDFQKRNAPTLFDLGSYGLAQQDEHVKSDLEEDKATNRYVVVLSKDSDGYTRSYMNEIDESLCLKIHNETYLKKMGDGIAELGSSYLALPFLMKNVGVGPALSLHEGTRFINEAEGQCCTAPRLLGVGDSLRFVLCIDLSEKWDFNDRFDITASYKTVTGRSLRFALEVTVETTPSKTSYHYTLAKEARIEDIVM